MLFLLLVWVTVGAACDPCCKADTGDDHELGNTAAFACTICSAHLISDLHAIIHVATHLCMMIKMTILGCLRTVMHVLQHEFFIRLHHAKLHYVATQSCPTSLMAPAAVLVTLEPLPFANAEGPLRLLSPSQQPGQQPHATHHQAEAQAPHLHGSSGHSFTKHSAAAGKSLLYVTCLSIIQYLNIAFQHLTQQQVC